MIEDEKLLERVGIDRQQIDNIDGRIPTMRFKAFKERA